MESSIKIPKFKNLISSTQTVMIYTNVSFNLEKIFKNINISSAKTVLTKRVNNIDKKKVEGNYGKIISIQRFDDIRGLDLKKKKKSDKLKSTNKVNYFRNQNSIWLCMNKKDGYSSLLNIMIFKDSLKLAGCSTIEQAIEAIMILWEEYIYPNKDMWEIWLPNPTNSVKFLIDIVMRNFSFNLGFNINRIKLNTFMNGEEYKNHVSISQHETTGHSNVNIKMYSDVPKNFKFDVLVYDLPENSSSSKIKLGPYFLEEEKNIYRKNKKKEKKFNTFIVFSTSEIILSGRYLKNMEEKFNFFCQEVIKKKCSVEERIEKKEKFVF